jgi:hypothetical protein
MQSAFRNLLDTRFYVNEPIVDPESGKIHWVEKPCIKAYLTYEEVLSQIFSTFCDEEANTLILYLSSYKFPTFKQQCEKAAKRASRAERAKAIEKMQVAQTGGVTIEDILKANKIDPNSIEAKRPKFWNDPSLIKKAK